MATFLLDCEVKTMELRIPRTHGDALVGYFDGSKGRDRAGTKAHVEANELWLESEGGRLVLRQAGDAYVARELDVFEDRAGEFFGRVVVNLFVTYRGKLHCKVRWDAPGAPDLEQVLQVEVDGGKSNWKGEFNPGVWLPEDAIVPVEAEVEEEEVVQEIPEDVKAKLEEAKRHWAEYQRLKQKGGQE